MSAKRCAILIRVSTSQQDHERQKIELSELAKKMGYYFEPDDIYEEKISAVKMDVVRVGLNRLLKDIRGGSKVIKMIFISEVSRLSREPLFGRQLLDEFSSLGIPMYIQNMGIPTLDENGVRSPMANIAFQMLLEFASLEASTTKARTHSGRLLAATKGHNHGGFTPYGYSSKNASKKLEINEEEAVVVRRIFDLINSGYGAFRICDILNHEGVPTMKGVGSPGTELEFAL